MTEQLITQLTSTRYDELVEQWLDGTLQAKWNNLKDKELTKKQQVEERQIRAIAMLFSEPDDSRIRDIRETIKKRTWRVLEFYRGDNKNIFVRVK